LHQEIWKYPLPPHPLPGNVRGREDKIMKKRKRKRGGNSEKNERKMKTSK
jgi:hypothetical protein